MRVPTETQKVRVAEVKSTTKRTEERQMRLAIGQVIRYRQQLAEGGRDVRAMIDRERSARPVVHRPVRQGGDRAGLAA